jgi:hypothetical protein
MKKTLVLLVAFVLGMAVTSCKQGQKAEVTNAVEEAVEAANPAEVLTNLIEKAKAEGANWTVDQWKDVVKESFIAMVPTMKSLADFEAVMASEAPDSAAIAEATAKLKAGEIDYATVRPVLEQFINVLKSFPNGKAVYDDKEFFNSMAKECGLPTE